MKNKWNKEQQKWSDEKNKIIIPISALLLAREFRKCAMESIASRTPIQVYLKHEFYLVTSPFNGQWYIGFHKLNKDKTIMHGTGCNLSVSEFNIPIQNFNFVRDYKPFIETYHWKCLHKDKIIRRSLSSFYSLEDAKNDYENKQLEIRDMYDIESNPNDFEFKVDCEWLPVPDDHTIIKRCYVFYVKELAIQRAKRNCQGCCINSPSQKDHMNGGCLDLPSIHISTQLDDIHKEPKFYMSVLHIFNRVRNWMGFKTMAPETVDLLAEIIVEYMSDEKIIEECLEPDERFKGLDLVLLNCINQHIMCDMSHYGPIMFHA